MGFFHNFILPFSATCFYFDLFSQIETQPTSKGKKIINCTKPECDAGHPGWISDDLDICRRAFELCQLRQWLCLQRYPIKRCRYYHLNNHYLSVLLLALCSFYEFLNTVLSAVYMFMLSKIGWICVLKPCFFFLINCFDSQNDKMFDCWDMSICKLISI